MKVNGESIYGTSPGPLESLPWGRCTAKSADPTKGMPARLYLHVFDWPASKQLAVAGLTKQVAKAYLLADADRKALIVKQEAKSAVVGVPEKAPDPHDSVIVLELGD